VSDITYLKTNSGWLYLTVILDLWDRTVIGWAFLEDREADHVCDALMMACTNHKPKSDLLFHSDRGVQYCSKEFRDALSAWCPQVGRSMSRKGNCWDNTCAESFFKTLKVEVDKVEGTRTKEEVRVEVFEYIELYCNKRRRHSTLGYAIPIALTHYSTGSGAGIKGRTHGFLPITGFFVWKINGVALCIRVGNFY
jgi:transposase InsO family protein